MRTRSYERIHAELSGLDKSALVDRLAKLEGALEYGVDDDNQLVLQTLVHELEVHQVELEMQNRELRESQAALEKASERYGLLYEYAPIGYCTVNLDGIIRQCNQATKKLFRRQSRSILGAYLGDIVDVPTQGELKNYLLKCQAGAQTGLLEARFVGTASGVKSLQIIGVRKPGYPDGEKEVLLAFIDRTAETIASDHDHFLLRASEILAQSVGVGDTIGQTLSMARRHNDGLVCLDIWRKGERAQRFLSNVQQAGGSQLESVVATLMGNSTCEHIERYIQRCRIVQKPGIVVSGKFKTLFGDDAIVEALQAEAVTLVVVAPLYARGESIGVLSFLQRHDAVLRDATLVGKLNQYARQAASYIDNAYLLEHANMSAKSREQVLAVVSHDLRSPLAAIRMRSERLQHGRQASSEPRVLDAARLIVKYVERMDHLIGDLLDVSVINAGTLSMACEHIDVSNFLRDVLETWTPAYEARGIALDTTIVSGVFVFADRDRLLQALGNLLGNALKFTSAGGQVHVTATARADCVQFTVVDTGAGISEEKLSHVFEKFWQARNGDRAGIGLGLCIAQGIIEAARGRIWIESKEHQGTSVHFTLPQRDDERLENTDVRAILVVDDDHDQRALLKDVLEDAGHKVDSAQNGAEALDYLFQHNLPRLIILDIRMPVMDGWQFLQRKRELALFKDIDVIVCSSESGAATRAQSYNARFVSKGCELDDLIAMTAH